MEKENKQENSKEEVKKTSALSTIHGLAKGVKQKHPKYEYRKCMELATKEYHKQKKLALKNPPAKK